MNIWLYKRTPSLPSLAVDQNNFWQKASDNVYILITKHLPTEISSAYCRELTDVFSTVFPKKLPFIWVSLVLCLVILKPKSLVFKKSSKCGSAVQGYRKAFQNIQGNCFSVTICRGCDCSFFCSEDYSWTLPVPIWGVLDRRKVLYHSSTEQGVILRSPPLIVHRPCICGLYTTLPQLLEELSSAVLLSKKNFKVSVHISCYFLNLL